MPEKINKTAAALITLLVIVAGTIGYAFGLDKGYETGLADGGRQPMQQQPLVSP
jgi:hypothetical protein